MIGQDLVLADMGTEVPLRWIVASHLHPHVGIPEEGMQPRTVFVDGVAYGISFIVIKGVRLKPSIEHPVRPRLRPHLYHVPAHL